ncbi:MAG: hypothetical protein V1859_06735 [archaeon]
MKKIAFTAIFAILLVLAAHDIFAVGIVPSSKEIIFEPSKTENIQLKLINSESEPIKVFIYAEGELANFIKISQTFVEIKGNDATIISYTLSMPQSFERQGTHEGKIIARQTADSQSEISAEIGVTSNIIIKVPYSGKYVEAKLFVPNFEQGESSNFAIEATSLGEEKIIDATGYIDIYGPLNDKIITLKSETYSIEPKQKKIISINWDPKLLPGKYVAKATVVYDSKNAFDEKSFSIGKSTVEIDSISVNNFKLGAIAQFDILASSYWNEEINNIYADAKITDKANNVFALSKTVNYDIAPYGKQELKVYWDTSKVTQGDYKLDVTLHYLDKETKKSFDISVGLDKILLQGAGNVIESVESNKEESMPKTITILVILVAILVATNIVIVVFKLKKEKNSK